MTDDAAQDLPALGGSYIRDADGTLRPVPALPEAADKAAVEAPVKPAVKEA